MSKPRHWNLTIHYDPTGEGENKDIYERMSWEDCLHVMQWDATLRPCMLVVLVPVWSENDLPPLPGRETQEVQEAGQDMVRLPAQEGSQE